MKRLCYGCLPAFLLMACAAYAQINPLSVIGGAVSTAMDARTTTEVKNDLEITAAVSQRFASDKSVEWKNVSLLVFGQHVVLVGTVSSADVRKRVNEIALADKRVRSVIDELAVVQKSADEGSFVADKTVDTKIDVLLTSTKGVSSINMRWKTVNGKVVIMGIARSSDEIELALSKIRGIDGVKTVVSRLRIVAAKR